MTIGFVGAGEGGPLLRPLLEAGRAVVLFDRSPALLKKHSGPGLTPVRSPSELIERLRKENGRLLTEERELPPPITLCLVIPGGPPMDRMIEELRPALLPGDLILDGSASRPKDTLKRVRLLQGGGILACDLSIDPGHLGTAVNPPSSLQVGGDPVSFARLCRDLAPLVFDHAGQAGAAHTLRMVRNARKIASIGLDREISRLLSQGTAEIEDRFLPRPEDCLGTSRLAQDLLWTLETSLEQGISVPLLSVCHALGLPAEPVGREDSGGPDPVSLSRTDQRMETY